MRRGLRCFRSRRQRLRESSFLCGKIRSHEADQRLNFFNRMKSSFLAVVFLGFVGGLFAAPVVADKIPTQFDALVAAQPSQVHLAGWLGRRVDQNLAERLAVVDTEPLLAGFKQKPGSHQWIGEHVGKWMHAATLTWDYSQDAKLRAKLDAVAAELIAAQEADGYLGTYAADKRMGLFPQAEWDVWSHKYCMIGLLTYYRYTGNSAALGAAQRAADLLLRTFPSSRSILKAGTHEGMAATSVLEPMVDLYRLTGDSRYLEFCRYLVRSYDEPGGPGIVRRLLAEKQVIRVGNRKAYEMLSNLVGLVELARVTGDRELITAVTNGWTDIVENRLYLTGSTSTYELFPNDHELSNGAEDHIGETCVTTTWIQLSRALLVLTGEAKYAAEIERSVYNHLTAAQRPTGGDWCYYTPLEGRKPYDAGITCCHSSGPRGLALAPTVAFLTDREGILVNTLETSNATLVVDGQEVRVSLVSGFPFTGGATLRIDLRHPARFALRIRVPEWSRLKAGDRSSDRGWLEIPTRSWQSGDTVALDFALAPKLITGAYTNFGRIAYQWGPFVLALDRAENREAQPLPSIRVLTDRPLTLEPGPQLKFRGTAQGQWVTQPVSLTFTPFADAGGTNEEIRVWLRQF